MLFPTCIAKWPDLETGKELENRPWTQWIFCVCKRSFQNQKMDLLGQLLDTTDL